MDVSPKQIVSVAAALIPFLEHDDANRALMGANMQRQAVPLLRSEAPLIGTGVEFRAAVDAGDVVMAEEAGVVEDVSADDIVVKERTGSLRTYKLLKFRRSNQGTCINQKPIVSAGRQGRRRARSSPTARPPSRASSRWARTCWWRSCPGRATTTRTPSCSPSGWSRTTSSPPSTSRSTRSTPATRSSGAEEITRDIPNVSEEILKDLDERGIVRIGAEVEPRRLPGRQGHAQGRDGAHARGAPAARDLR